MCLFSYSGSCHFLCGSHPGGVSELSELEEVEVLEEDDDMGEEEDPAAGLFEPTTVAPPPTPEEPPLSFSPST